MGHEAAVADELHQELRDRLALQRLARRAVTETAFFTINQYFVAGVDPFCLRADESRQPEIDRIPVEEAGERLGDQRRDAEVLQRLRRLLARGARAEVAAADDDVALAHAGSKGGINIFHAVARDFADVELEVAAGRDRIRVDVVAEDPGLHCSISRGSAMRPATAEAATV